MEPLGPAMNVVRKKRSQFASRAHSFKENLLEALKHGQGSPARRTRVGKEAIVLAKKTGEQEWRRRERQLVG